MSALTSAKPKCMLSIYIYIYYICYVYVYIIFLKNRSNAS